MVSGNKTRQGGEKYIYQVDRLSLDFFFGGDMGCSPVHQSYDYPSPSTLPSRRKKNYDKIPTNKATNAKRVD